MGNAVGDVGVSSFICPALKVTRCKLDIYDFMLLSPLNVEF